MNEALAAHAKPMEPELRATIAQDVIAGRSSVRDVLQAIHQYDLVDMDDTNPARTAFQCRSLAPLFADIATASASIGAEANNRLLEALTVPEYLPSFREAQDVAIESEGGLQHLPSGGTAPEVGLYANAENVQLQRFAASIVIDEVSLINAARTVNLITAVPRELTRRASRIGADWLAWHLLNNTVMADGIALFHTDRNNTGAAALDTTTLAAARAALKGQSDDSGVLDLDGRFLLTSAALGDTGRKLLTDSEPALPEVDRMRPLASARLDAGAEHPVTEADAAGSTTAWFLFADPRELPAFKTYYLAGTQKGVRVDASPLTHGRYGVFMRISLDICVHPVNPKAIYRGNS